MDRPFVVSIVGARPNFVKLAALSPELRKVADEMIIHTGQHYDYEMDRIFFDEMGISEPDYHLGVGSGLHGEQTGNMLGKIEEVLMNIEPDGVIVYGDTNSTLAGALAAAKIHIPVIHIEAGLRSFDMKMPEEINRVIVDHISDLLFCPTPSAACNVENERVNAHGIFVCGDVMADLLLDKLKPNRVNTVNLSGLDNYYLLTIHREENDNIERLKQIFKGLEGLEGIILFPCHPRIKKHLAVLAQVWSKQKQQVRVISPVGYFQMRELEWFATRIITDSGGVQKEAYLLTVPCITIRNSTEWVETMTGKWNVLTGTDPEKIRAAMNIIPELKNHDPDAFGKPGVCARTAKKIVENIHG